MVDRASEYTQSKYARRLTSRQKRCQKQMYVKESSTARRPKAKLAADRKHWSKYNKKSKPRTAEQFHLFDARQILTDELDEYRNVDWGRDTDYHCRPRRTPHFKPLRFDKLCVRASDAPELSSIAASYDGTHYVSALILKSQALALFSRQFHSFDATLRLRPFAGFEGECGYWRHIMTKLGVIDELYTAMYLRMCHRDSSGNADSYYADFVDAIAKKMLSTPHLLHILDAVEAECRRDFAVDCAVHAKRVVSDRAELLRLLEVCDVGNDLATLIGEFTMRSDDILARFHTDDAPQRLVRFETKKYRIDGHDVMDIMRGSTVKAKIFDGKDITKAYRRCDQTFEKSKPRFHYGAKRKTFGKLLSICWFHFTKYYAHQQMHGLSVRWEVLLSILLFVTESASVDVCEQLSLQWSRHRKHYRVIMAHAVRETVGIVRDLFRMTYRELERSRMSCAYHTNPFGFEQRHRQNMFALIQRTLLDADDSAADTKRVCAMIGRSFYLAHCSVDADEEFLEHRDHHTLHKKYWTDIWKGMPQTMNDSDSMDDLRAVWDLMTRHNAIYQKAATKRKSWGYLRRHWGEHKMDSFDAAAFVRNDIAPLVIARMPSLMAHYSLDQIKNEMCKWTGIRSEKSCSPSFDEFLCEMREMISALDEEHRRYNLCESRMLFDANEYAVHSFRRKHTAKRRSLKKAELRKTYRKYNGKSEDKRVERKMRKFAPSFRSL